LDKKKYKFTIQYDGLSFHGWQRQKSKRTIQGDIERALKTLFPRENISLIASGRTDSGVHSLGQIAHAELPGSMASDKLCKAINGNLKRDVHVLSVKEVDKNFHARYSAKSREYEYHLAKYFSPLTRYYVAQLKWKIDLDKMNAICPLLLGQHDFTSFCKTTAEVENKICTIYNLNWVEKEEKYIFNIRANRFLQHMVRYIVGTMIEVGRDRYTLQDFINILNNEKIDKAVVKAPAKGLFLKKIYYV
tara:strand:+ start:2168 stop:2908 length:741 start_codon:yes stop_codon:yes gene_type:complete